MTSASTTDYFAPRNISSEEVSLNFARYVIYRVTIPIVCGFGVISNSVNVSVFSRRWRKHTATATEKAALVGLLALSLSDLLFCFFGIPAAFLDPNSTPNSNATILPIVSFYYDTYRDTLMNMALYSSTWCIVLVSLERYLAVCHPFQARFFIRVWKTALLHLAVLLCAILISLPDFLRHTVDWAPCNEDYICYYRLPRRLFFQREFLVAYRVLWLTVGTFIPLGLMCFCNIRLLVEIYRSKKQGLTDPDRYCTTRLTLTVAGIISMFFILVCPSMVLGFVSTIMLLINKRDEIFPFQVAMLATNLLQAIKFATNFLWYCAVNSHFRETLECALRRRSWSRNSSENKVEMTLLK